MNTATFRHKQELPVVFVHSVLDELGLGAAEFRLYCHLARRADNSTRIAYAAHESMASVCRLDIKTVRRALQALVERSLITVERRPGYPNCYRLAPQSCWQSSADTEARDEPVRPGAPPMHPRCQTSKGVRCQTGKEVTPSAPHEGNPPVLLKKGNPQEHTVGKLDDVQAPDRACVPAAAFSISDTRVEAAESDEHVGTSAPERPPTPPLKTWTTPKTASCDRKIPTTLRNRFDEIWSQLRPEYRGDRQPALVAFALLNPDDAQLQRIVSHRMAWEKLAAESEMGTAGWVPKPKHFANYLRVRQFETSLPQSGSLRPVRVSGGLAAYTPPPPTPEAERIAALKRLGIVALDLLNGRAELEDHYAFATDVVGTVRYQQILEIEDRLRRMHAEFEVPMAGCTTRIRSN